METPRLYKSKLSWLDIVDLSCLLQMSIALADSCFFVCRLREILSKQKETVHCREKMVKVLEELQAQAEVGLCFLGIKH